MKRPTSPNRISGMMADKLPTNDWIHTIVFCDKTMRLIWFCLGEEVEKRISGDRFIFRQCRLDVASWTSAISKLKVRRLCYLSKPYNFTNGIVCAMFVRALAVQRKNVSQGECSIQKTHDIKNTRLDLLNPTLTSITGRLQTTILKALVNVFTLTGWVIVSQSIPPLRHTQNGGCSKIIAILPLSLICTDGEAIWIAIHRFHGSGRSPDFDVRWDLPLSRHEGES